MRKAGFKKYKNEMKEIMPKSYRVETKIAQRRLFFDMVNNYLEPSMRVPLHDATLFRQSIPEIFIAKIFDQVLPCFCRRYTVQKTIGFYLQETPLFNQFFKQCRHPKARFLSKHWEFDQQFAIREEYGHAAAKMIAMIFDGKEVSLMLDLNTMFTHTVYSRIKREPGKEITLDAPYIHISANGHRTRLLPQWKHVNPKDIHQRSRQIESGLRQLQDDPIDAMYLVYPKTDAFTKHITIRSKEKHELKMIPYSFTYTNRKEKKCRK